MEGKQSAYHVGDVKYHLGRSAVYAFDRHTRRRVDENVSRWIGLDHFLIQFPF